MARDSDGRASNGGARPGAGRLPTSIPISGPGIIYLRELTRSRLGRQEVTRNEMGATMEELLGSEDKETTAMSTEQLFRVEWNCWRYGESEESGHDPKLRSGEIVTEVGPRSGDSTYVKTRDGAIESVLISFLVRLRTKVTDA
jgi:hypothetical protein